MKVSCECGKQFVVGKAVAGSSIECDCGSSVCVPRSEPPSTEKNAAKKPHHNFSFRKKIALTTVTLLLLAAPGWLVLEIISINSLVPVEPDEIETSAAQLAREGPGTTAAQVETLRIEASYLASQERFSDAAKVAVRLSNLDIPDRTAQLVKAFDWHLRSGNSQAAEDDLRRALQINADDLRPHRLMAQLLNSQGRRYEAHRYTLALARSGAITPRELLSLIDLGGPFELVSFQEIIGDVSGTLFALGKARHLYVAEEDAEAALQTLDRLASTTQHPAAEALRGRLMAETMDNERFQAWIRQVPTGTDQHPEYWSAIARWLSHNGRDQQAVRAFGEALRRDPTDRRSLRALASLLNRIGDNEKAKSVQQTLAILDSIFRLATDADAKQAMEIATHLQALTRLWESIAWFRLAFQTQGTLDRRSIDLNQRAKQVLAWEESAGEQEIRNARLKKMLGFDIGTFPMPDLTINAASPVPDDAGSDENVLQFSEVAESLGVTTGFISDYPLDRVDFYLHQANGGGLAALDYDLDGLCDLYIAQSGGDPNQQGSSAANQLYHQLPGEGFADVSTVSQANDHGYGQGVCAGDLNQDGFPDLLVANIGRNAVYINQGDGTFRARSDALPPISDRWTSSLALADLDGDQLPDVVEVNYVDDPLIFQRKCVGKQLDCTPQRFRAASDRIFRSRGDGQFETWEGAGDIESLPNYGFGIVVADFDGQNGNDLFISNDGDLNHYWKSGAAGDSQTVTYQLTEQAGLSGCSVGTSGISQACMGIAAGDFDRNDLLDLLVTNFHNEPVNLFLQNQSGFFVDQALRYGLAEPARNVLGFGTQAADFDNDGWLDIAILNGHIYDASYAGIPFRMVSQLFRGSGDGFSLQAANSAGPYWRRRQLARTLASWDFNRDGNMDLVANHLDQPVAILRNESDSGNWLQLELVGVDSDRDAVGARVTVQADGRRWNGWQTGGDGYMCTNEPVIHWGLGRSGHIEEVEIDWPSGRKQTISSLEANNRYLMIEGQPAIVR